jgi:iodotyrosine deiodinase
VARAWQQTGALLFQGQRALRKTARNRPRTLLELPLARAEIIHHTRRPMTQKLDQPGFIPLTSFREYPAEEMIERSRRFAADMQRRRTVRQFSNRPVERQVIDACLETAGTAPSGAHQQPWHFVVISDPETKREIRVAAEQAEAEFYRTAPKQWLAALAPLGTDEHKPYLEDAPYLIAVFAARYGIAEDQSRQTHYYVMESVGIATGFLIAALHNAGLATLTHTPNPMGFLNELLKRPSNERAVMLVVCGYPAPDAKVPDLKRKPLEEIATHR